MKISNAVKWAVDFKLPLMFMEISATDFLCK